ncbi:MAG: hypothetical protein ISS88_02300 [Candidatus Portnoybacteria bacterium]|nr:hypothetical protein [Candidatus Portnoybacteria bacterium]
MIQENKILGKFSVFHRRLFIELVEKHFDPVKPRQTFVTVAMKFQRILRNQGVTYYWVSVRGELQREYLKYLAAKGITLERSSLTSFKTSVKKRKKKKGKKKIIDWEAAAHELYHQKRGGID